MIFIEKPARFSQYIKFIDYEALAADIPKLSVLRVELERVHPGMADFVMRVSSPKYAGVKSGTVLSIRGQRSFTKYDTMKTLATTICKEMVDREDKTFDWSNVNHDHMADLFYGPLKYFATNTRIEQCRFTTEALQ